MCKIDGYINTVTEKGSRCHSLNVPDNLYPPCVKHSEGHLLKMDQEQQEPYDII